MFEALMKKERGFLENFGVIKKQNRLKINFK